MTANEGTTDRVVRIALGLLLLSLTIFGPQTWWGLAGLVPLVTGFVGYCPLSQLLGISSCRRPPAGAKREPLAKGA